MACTCGLVTTRTTKTKRFAGVVLLLLWIVHASTAIEWLAVANWNGKFWNKTSECRRKTTSGFVKTHRLICKRNLELMPVVAHASREAVTVCLELFHKHRWNCSSVMNAPSYSADLQGAGNREQAFVSALSAATLTHSIAKACTMGITTKCGCGGIPNEAPPGDFKWGGCGDDIRFGLVFSKTFGDAAYERENKKVFAVVRHNNALGRKLVQDSLKTACKCHGVSGSCSIKTCWKGLPDVRSIGKNIKESYHGAVEVKYRRRKPEGRKFVAKYGHRRKISDGQMIYIKKSPDYCLPDKRKGSVGTKGRECDKDDRGPAGCASMCCGRGYRSEVVEVKYRCDCKYYWCCYVKCKTCYKTVEVNRCR